MNHTAGNWNLDSDVSRDRACQPLLTPSQELFCREYLIDLNAARAVTRAGYKTATARQQGQRLLTKVCIQDEIARLMAVRKQRLDIEADKVVKELAIIAFSDFSDFAVVENQQLLLRDTVTIPPHLLPALAEIKRTIRGKGGTTRLRMHDKVRALSTLLQHLGGLQPSKMKESGDDSSLSALLYAAQGGNSGS